MSTQSERPMAAPTPSPAVFAAGAERRDSPRVPLRGAVKMGPPGGAPYAVVSATDLSLGGLFIDADRPVKVGARFSAEIELSSGEVVYVPEAEVAYNRERATGSGFGVRFIEVPSDVRTKIEAEVEQHTPALARAAGATLAAVPSLPPVSHYEILESKSAMELPAFEIKTDDTPKKRRRAKKDANLTEPRMNDDVETLAPRLADDIVLPPIAAMRAASPSELDVAVAGPSGFAKTIGPTALPREPSLDEASATEVPAPRVFVDYTRYPEPIVGDDDAGDDEEERSMTEVPAEGRRSIRDAWEGVMRVGQDARHAFVERARRSPPVWTGVAALGLVTVLSAAGLTIWMGSSAEAVEVAPKNPAGMSATTQRVLMGEQKTAPVEAAKESAEPAAKPESTAEAKKPLPPLVVVDPASDEVLKQPEAEAAATASAATAAAKGEAKSEAKAEPKKAEKKAEAKAEKKAEAKPAAAQKDDAEDAAADAEAEVKVEPKKAEKAEKAEKSEAKAEPKKAEKAEKAEAKAEPKKAEKPAKADAKAEKSEKAEKPAKADAKAEKTEKTAKGRAEAHELAEKFRAELKDEPRAKKDAAAAKPSKLKIPVGAGASVLKTHVFKGPDRFVIDVVSKGAIKAPAATGNVKSVRVGKHADYTRIVIETKAPIDHGQVSKSGKDLAVTLDYLR